jgi:hypothetical protein
VNPDFDELVGDVAGDERARLERIHELLLVAGPPPELSPEIERGPTLAMTLGKQRTRRQMQRRVGLLAAAVVILLVAFLLGYITGNDSTSSGRLLKLQGTALAPSAQGSLRIDNRDEAGNWPMEFAAFGLRKLPGDGYYEVFLVRDHGKQFFPCGGFIAKNAKLGVSVRLNAPYRLQKGDVWIVTKQNPGDRKLGPVVMKPLT